VHRAASEQPVIAAHRFLAARAQSALVTGALVECAVVLLLVDRPAVGLTVAAVLLLVYRALLGAVDEQLECDCLGALSAMSAATARRRNEVLAGTSAIAAMVGELARSEARPAPAIGFAAVVLAPLVAWEVQHRFWTTARRSI
jgi:hypothetical protein